MIKWEHSILRFRCALRSHARRWRLAAWRQLAWIVVAWFGALGGNGVNRWRLPRLTRLSAHCDSRFAGWTTDAAFVTAFVLVSCGILFRRFPVEPLDSDAFAGGTDVILFYSYTNDSRAGRICFLDSRWDCSGGGVDCGARSLDPRILLLLPQSRFGLADST